MSKHWLGIYDILLTVLRLLPTGLNQRLLIYWENYVKRNGVRGYKSAQKERRVDYVSSPVAVKTLFIQLLHNSPYVVFGFGQLN